jgi:L-ascorbate metabolism protein UlaG (beta-lactamase superfamily)
MALWAAFVIEAPNAKVYHIGDTGFHGGLNYKAAAKKYGHFDLAILPIGAYAPRWFMKAQHQNPCEAVAGFKLCNAKAAIGHHWGTFQLTNEAIDAPKQDLMQALKDADINPERFTAMHPGQVWQR